METDFSKIMVYISIGVCIIVLILIGVMCRQIFITNGTPDLQASKSIEQVILSFFDKEGLNYSTKTYEDSEKGYFLSFNDSTYLRVIVRPNTQFYYILGNLLLKNNIAPEDRTLALEQINLYNSTTAIGQSFIDDEGQIMFCIGHSCNDGAYSVESFKDDFYTLFRHINDSTPKILEKAGLSHYNAK